MDEPKLEQFGLIKEQYDLLSKKRLSGHKFINDLSFAVCVLTVSLIFWNTSPEEDRIFNTICAGIFLGPLVGMFVGKGAWFLFIRSRSRYSQEYRKLAQYEASHKNYEEWWNRTQESFWLSLSGKQFESELARLYSKLGYRVDLPKMGGGDKGIDFALLYEGGARIIVQCKRHKKPVGPHAARDLYGTLINSRAQGAILASVSGFTPGVLEFVERKRIKLVSLEDIKRMVKEA